MSTTVLQTRRESEWTLVDLLGVEMLQAIQDSFAHAFRLPTVIVDRRGQNITEITHRVAFCEDLTRPSAAGAKCTACDAAAMDRAEETGRPEIFHCWNGLHDSAVPIISSDGEQFGFFLCGQVFAERPVIASYRETARRYGIGIEGYAEAADRIRVVPLQTLEQTIECMGVLARMIADQASAAIQRLRTLEAALAANAATERLAAELDTIVGACAAIASTGDTVATLGQLAESIGRVIPYDSCMFFELEPDCRRLRLLALRDPYADAIGDWRPEVGHGIAGSVAGTGVALRLDDAAGSDHFEPIPGVPLEPEAMLAVPMLLDGEVIGVITLSRFQRQTFSEHELDLVRILASQCATALGTARFRSEIGRRLAQERTQGAVYRRIVAGGEPGQLLEQIVRDTSDLLGCCAAALTLSEAGLPFAAPRFRADDRRLDRIGRLHGAALERARSTLRPTTVEGEEEAVLIAPVEVAGRAVAELLLWRERAFGEEDERLAAAAAQQTAVALGNARVERSERQLLAGYKLLAELGAELAAAESGEAIARLLANRAHELVGASGALVVLGGELAGTLEVWSRSNGSVEATSVPTAGRPQLRLPVRRLPSGGEELFDAWAGALAEAVGDDRPYAIGVPLLAAAHPLGGLVALGERPFGRDDHKLLSVLANTAAGSFAAAAARRESDETLRARAQELGALTELAQTVTAAHDADAVALAVLDAFRVLSGSSAAAIVVPAARNGLKVAWSLGLDAGRRRELVSRLPSDILDEPRIVDDGAVLAVPLEVGTSSLGLIVADAADGPSRPGVLSSLARYGAIALENARLLESERSASAELRELHRRQITQADELERSLTIQRALSQALLSRNGLDRVAETLAALQGGTVAVYDHDLKPIAGVPEPATGLDFAEQVLARQDGQETGLLEVELAEGWTIIAAAIRAEGDQLGWIVQRLARPVGEVDRTAIAHAALAAAVAILRDREEEEAEGRLRGELLEALFASEAPADELVATARALGYDITQPSRVAVAELVTGTDSGGDQLYRAAIAWAGRRGGFLVGRRGREIAVVGPPEDVWPRELHAELSRAVGTTRLGVGAVASTPRDHRESFLGARHARIALRATGRSGVLALDDPGLDQLLVRATDAGRLVAFADSILAPLAAYDARRASDLVGTLERVVGKGWNLQAAARDAHVHVSTLRYRLTRIESLAGIDLSGPDDRLAVQLALRIDRLLQRRSPHEP